MEKKEEKQQKNQLSSYKTRQIKVKTKTIKKKKLKKVEFVGKGCGVAVNLS